MRDFQIPGRSPVFATRGMCATSHPLAALTAIDILRRGGNAMDAAIAGAVILGICEPHMTGIGGDAFVLWTPPGSDKVQALNGSGRAPGAADAQALRDRGLDAVPEDGAEAVTIPGAVEAFCHLAESEGRLGLDALLAPAIDAAERGVPVAPRVAMDWAGDADRLSGAAREHYLPGGRAPSPGTLFRAPAQAEVLRRLASQGRRAFYEGEIAEDMLAALAARGGVHTAEDFAGAEATPAAPIAGSYRGRELVEHPPNGQGAAAILLAQILAQFDLAALDPLGPERAHLEAEAWKLAEDARNRFLADPAHADAAKLTDPATARRLAALIRPDAVLPDPAALTEAIHRDTVYITVVDRDRMAVSLIYSIYHGFGSGIASEKFGILLHNRGAGFTLEQGHPNEYGPGKRPLHTIIPAMLREGGRVTMPFGVMGGGYQPTGHARFLSNIADFGMDPQAALDAPRAFADGGVLKLERGYPDSTRRALEALGHQVVTPERPLGGGQAIMIRDSGVLEGASDPRKDGCALGY
ncbi:gamma-glutamyltransferase [Rhodosalinus halophilus]|uniref:Gamma-glutamyltransferase n=1 Tax=Rhodosalinus halophilus TaxID=2259333 RepID=A0A365UAT3_9RHOB|nr:gamma-glutamyltransferase family protein [Rhodosalinus halophilus]RBI86254.1 gamma-glutamyltransferase [Rhodosalinus halophilus]